LSLRPLYQLDTNICIDLMKHQSPQVAERFSACRVGEVLISAITAAELEVDVVASGVEAERNGAALAHFLLEVPVAPFNWRLNKPGPPLGSARRRHCPGIQHCWARCRPPARG
jgi:tRNA(fMet)-specific endonuclease VapC